MSEKVSRKQVMERYDFYLKLPVKCKMESVENLASLVKKFDIEVAGFLSLPKAPFRCIIDADPSRNGFWPSQPRLEFVSELEYAESPAWEKPYPFLMGRLAAETHDPASDSQLQKELKAHKATIRRLRADKRSLERSLHICKKERDILQASESATWAKVRNACDHREKRYKKQGTPEYPQYVGICTECGKVEILSEEDFAKTQA